MFLQVQTGHLGVGDLQWQNGAVTKGTTLCFPSAQSYSGTEMAPVVSCGTREAAAGLHIPCQATAAPIGLLRSAPSIEWVQNLGDLCQVFQLNHWISLD